MPPVLIPGFAKPPALVRPIHAGGGQTIGAPPAQTTIRYVRKSGSDSNGGTSPSDAWLTIQKAMTTVSPGTVIYVGAGVYRETVAPTVSGTAGLPISLVGDVDGLRTGDAGMVQVTAYLTSDKSAPSGSTTLNVTGSSSFLTFRNIFFCGGSASPSVVTVNSGPHDITFVDCAFVSDMVVNVSTFTCVGGSASPSNVLIDRCVFHGRSGISLTFPTSNATGGDYDMGVVVSNSVFLCLSVAVDIIGSGSAAFKPGGAVFRNCSFLMGGNPAIRTNGTTTLSTSIPSRVLNTIIFSAGTALSAGLSGHLVEDYNLILGTTARTNVPVGAHSIADGSYATLLHVGQERIWGGALRPLGEPLIGSPLTAFGAADTLAGLIDERGAPRPAAAARWAVGALQRGNNFVKETGTVHTGSNAISVTGDGFQDFDLPVAAGAITVSIWVRYDSSYTGPLPELRVLANQELTVGEASVQSSRAGLNGWEQLQLTVNPTGAGILTVRIVSGDTSGIGHVYADSFAAA